MLIIRRSICITQHLVSSHSVGGRPVRTGRPPTECDDSILYLLMINTKFSKHVEEYNKLIIKQELCIKLVSY